MWQIHLIKKDFKTALLLKILKELKEGVASKTAIWGKLWSTVPSKTDAEDR